MLLALLGCQTPVPLDLPSAPSADIGAPWSEPSETSVGLLLNEVLPVNASTLMGPWGLEDYVELYNAGPGAVDLSRVTLSDGTAIWTGEGELPVGEVRLLWCGADLPFRLSGGGDHLELRVDDALVDTLATGDMPDDVVLQRYPDGQDWGFSIDATPGQGNQPPTEDLDPSTQLFGPYTLHEVDLTISEDGLLSLDGARETKVPASVLVDGIRYDEVGVRLKGRWGSRRELSEKTAWKVDLNYYDPIRYRGQETLVLNNMVQDPTYVHEWLTYTVYRAMDMPAPRTGWAWVRVNGDDYGLYALIENVDDRLLRRWYSDHTGFMVEGAYGVDLEADEIHLFELDEGGQDGTWQSALMDVAEVLEQPPTDENVAWLETLVDLDQMLMNMAIEVHVLHWDGYTTSNNYRLYQNPLDGRLQILPWGTDQTWVDYRYDLYESGNGRAVLFDWCLANEGCTLRYESAVYEVEQVLVELALDEELVDVLAWLQPYVDADPRREWSDSERDRELSGTFSTLDDWGPSLVSRLP
jgi:hypothetical protein